MVQVRDLKRRTATNYWKLEPARATLRSARKDLDAFSHPYKNAGASLEQLNYHRTRAERSLISYERYTFEELLKFAEDRQLRTPAIYTKDGLIALLHDEDEFPTAATPTHFDRLPLEFRHMVYDYYFLPFLAYIQNQASRTGGSLVPPPPLACTNRAMRYQVLEQLYSHVRFTCTARIMWGEGLGNRFFQTAPDGILAHVQRLTLKRRAQDRDYWHINLPRGGKKFYLVDYVPDLRIHRWNSSRRHLFRKNEILQARQELERAIDHMVRHNNGRLDLMCFQLLKWSIQY
ncbi:hypothetical protein Slin14017_G094610 [Septoria linicola]|nr:hypothetical protein Slin14017_G094610 [Septoria linicola]